MMNETQRKWIKAINLLQDGKLVWDETLTVLCRIVDAKNVYSLLEVTPEKEMACLVEWCNGVQSEPRPWSYLPRDIQEEYRAAYEVISGALITIKMLRMG